jgi:hypothetical protein
VSRRGGTRVRPTKKPIVVVAGEDRNDRLALRVLLEEFCPEMRGRIVVELARFGGHLISIGLRFAPGVLPARLLPIDRVTRLMPTRPERASLSGRFAPCGSGVSSSRARSRLLEDLRSAPDALLKARAAPPLTDRATKG